MSKMSRRAASVAILIIAAAVACVIPQATSAQGQTPAPPATPAPPKPPAAPPAPASAATSPSAPLNATSPATPAGAKAAIERASTAEVENPYGLESIWRGSDWVAKGTLIILVIMSMGTWYILIVKLYEQAKLRREARAARSTFWKAPTVQQGATTLREGSAFRFIAESGIEATQKHEGLLGNVQLSDWVTMSIQRSIDEIQSRLQDGLAFLATVGSTAPFVGLFGTVWGIYHALTAIGIAGQASIDKVAGPVGEALIMTAIGLAVAVPAVLGYNWLVRRNKSSMDQVRGFGADLHAVLLSSNQAPARA
ncbi:MAG TPA: MotA/TolQ/ExbB proton channel family protein [Casimicrobiaceae bacterium]|nr:MotA/TolQ/ExbB proton channel family protein [Casimicrobiaceae bacterium]